MPEIVHVFIFDTLADWEAGFAIAGINNPDMQVAPGRYAIRTFSPDGKPVTSTGGLRITPDMALADVQPEDSAMLILPGGSVWDEAGQEGAIALAARFILAGKPVAAICGATAGLARGGLLDARRHTSNGRHYIAATGYRGGEWYSDEAAVSDQDVITASSMAPLEFAQAIFARLELYSPAMLAAWYGLFSTRDTAYFDAMMAAAGQGG